MSILGKIYAEFLWGEREYHVLLRMQTEQKRIETSTEGHIFTSYFRGYSSFRECTVLPSFI